MKRVLVVSHADADGHVIAEQARRNLETVSSFRVSTVVDPSRTQGHKAWLHLDLIPEIEESDIVLFVDLMFAPASFGTEADALVRFAKARPMKKFFVFDHHPLPMRKLSGLHNLRATYHADVLDCTVGTSSPMMIIAALCEKQPTRAKSLKKPIDDVIAKGMKRAAALGGPLPGAKLSALLRFGCWDALARLGEEDSSWHKLPRGRRVSSHESSSALEQLDSLASDLLKGRAPRTSTTRSPMAYDFETVTDRTPPVVGSHVPQPRDLEAIVTLLQLAAIELSPLPDSTFTLQELLDQVREIGGEGVAVEDGDVKLVLGKASFLKKVGKSFRLK